MPPKLSSPPDPRNPEYRLLRDRINFALHVALFLCVNVGLLFFEKFWQTTWTWRPWVNLGWLVLLVAHTVWIFWIAKYEEVS
jgi:hypothetical protein